MATRKLSPDELREGLRKSPLIGLTAAAKILGLKPSNVRRDLAGHLPEAVQVEGSASVYFRVEIEALARDVRRRRAKAERAAAAE